MNNHQSTEKNNPEEKRKFLEAYDPPRLNHEEKENENQ